MLCKVTVECQYDGLVWVARDPYRCRFWFDVDNGIRDKARERLDQVLEFYGLDRLRNGWKSA